MLISILHGGFYGAPYVPTNSKTYKKMIKAAKIKEGDKIYDLGSGDGRLVFAAAEKGAKATGIEINFFVHWLAKINKFAFRRKGNLIRGNIWKKDIGDADIVFCYLLPSLMGKIQEKFNNELKKGCVVVSHAFPLPEWEIIEHIPSNLKKREGSVWVQKKK